MLMQNIIIIKEGNTPEQFLKAWGRAFKDCHDEVAKRDKATAREFEILVCVCADAVLLIEKKPLRYQQRFVGFPIEMIQKVKAAAELQTKVYSSARAVDVAISGILSRISTEGMIAKTDMFTFKTS